MLTARSLVVFATALALCTLSTRSLRAETEINLAGFGTLDPDTRTTTLDDNGFEAFVGDLALALHPKFAGPGSTVGALGFDFGYQIALVDIDEAADHWTKPLGDPSGALEVSHFYVRKGLPYSFELGGVLTHLHDTSLFAVALEIKWAFVEGNKYAPDFGFRSHVNTVLGHRDFVMVTSGGDVFISKSFGIGGLVQITPYAGYELTYVHARSHVLGAFRTGGIEPVTFILPTQDVLRHRGLLGLRVAGGVGDFGFEAALGELMSYTFKVGLNL